MFCDDVAMGRDDDVVRNRRDAVFLGQSRLFLDIDMDWHVVLVDRGADSWIGEDKFFKIATRAAEVPGKM